MRHFGPYSLTGAFLLGRESYAYRAALYLSEPEHARVIDQRGITEGEFLADGERIAADWFTRQWLDGQA